MLTFNSGRDGNAGALKCFTEARKLQRQGKEQRIGAILPLILASGVLVNRLVLALQRRTALSASASLGMFADAARWASTLILPLMLAAVVNAQADAREQRQIAAHFAPLLDFIDRSVTESGRAPSELSGYVGFDRARLPFTYLYADDRDMVLARGGSIDIDGSIVFFDSRSKTWSRIHNDQMQSPTPPPDALHLLGPHDPRRGGLYGDVGNTDGHRMGVADQHGALHDSVRIEIEFYPSGGAIESWDRLVGPPDGTT